MNIIPEIVMEPSDTELLEVVAREMEQAVAAKDDPSTLRLLLVELQHRRFSVGQVAARYKAYARITLSNSFAHNKTIMSNNAAWKEAEASIVYVEFKNVAEIFEKAYESLDGFVTMNQTSLRLAAEEAKNTL